MTMPSICTVIYLASWNYTQIRLFLPINTSLSISPIFLKDLAQFKHGVVSHLNAITTCYRIFQPTWKLVSDKIQSAKYTFNKKAMDRRTRNDNDEKVLHDSEIEVPPWSTNGAIWTTLWSVYCCWKYCHLSLSRTHLRSTFSNVHPEEMGG